jgi:hypothetical protein
MEYRTFHVTWMTHDFAAGTPVENKDLRRYGLLKVLLILTQGDIGCLLDTLWARPAAAALASPHVGWAVRIGVGCALGQWMSPAGRDEVIE